MNKNDDILASSLILDKTMNNLANALSNLYTPHLFDSINKMQNTLATIINSSSFQNAITNSLNTITKVNEIMANNIMPNLLDSLNNSAISFGKALSNINYDYLNSISKALNNIDFEKIQVLEDCIEYEDEKITIEDLNITVNNFNNQTIVINKADKKTMVILTILLWFVTTFFGGFISKPGSDLYDYLVETYFKDKKADITDNKIICNEYCRLVFDFGLNVRSEPNSKSKVIEKLTYLSVVIEIDKKPYWTKIQYKDEEKDIFVTGWVATKYLKKLSVFE